MLAPIASRANEGLPPASPAIGRAVHEMLMAPPVAKKSSPHFISSDSRQSPYSLSFAVELSFDSLYLGHLAGKSKQQKNHYIPVFYLRQWMGGDERVCEFSKPYDRVKPRRTHPDGTGYVRGLNTIPGLPPHEAQYLEDVFFKIADEAAARALRMLLTPQPWNMSVDDKSGWSRFLMSLVHRHPESVERHRVITEALFKEAFPRIEADYATRRKSTDPPTYAQFAALNSPNPVGRIQVRLLQRVIDSDLTGQGLNSLRWIVLHDPHPKHLFLTSDRPVVMTNGLNKPDSQLLIPISPFHVFVATNNVETENSVRKIWNERQLIPQVNERVANQSRKYVWGMSDAQLSFIARRLGNAWTADPVESLTIDQVLEFARSHKSQK
jgi:Protein of unknown function (DUF4238)